MGNSSTSHGRRRKRDSTPEPPKNEKIKLRKRVGRGNDKESSDADPKLDPLSKLLRGTPLSNINDHDGCRCSFSSDSNDDSVEEEEDFTDSEEEGWLMGRDSDSDNDSEDDSEDMESWQDAGSDDDDDNKDDDDNDNDDGNNGSERSAQDDSDKSEGQQHSSQQASADGLMPPSSLKPSKEDTSDSEDDDRGLMDLLNGSDESAVSPSDCEGDDWMPSSSQMADILCGLSSGDKGFIRNVANILWKKEDLAMSYVPTVESPGVVPFTEFIPTRQPINQKRLDIVRREYLQLKTGAWGWKMKDVDWEKDGDPVAPLVRKADQLLADYIASLNKSGGGL